MGIHEADALTRTFMELDFDAGLHVSEAAVSGSPDAPIFLVRFEDQRSATGERQGAWWDVLQTVGADEVRKADPVFLSGLAKAFLEEVFHAGGPLADRSRDPDGMAWAELDWRGRHRLPPHLGTS